MAVIKQRSKKAGLPPRSLVYIGDQSTGDIRIDIIDYTEMKVQEKVVVARQKRDQVLQRMRRHDLVDARSNRGVRFAELVM